MKKEQNIVLIGFMGVGKSVIALTLAEDFDYTLIETDALIEQRMNMPVSSIFARYGEEYFRRLETKELARLADIERAVVSTGGGAVLREENVAHLRKIGVVVLLTATPETIYERIYNDLNRPLLSGDMSIEGITALMDKRAAAYAAAADITIATDGKTVTKIAREIRESL